MPFVLRIIRKARWYSDNIPWLQKGDLQADALIDLRTEGNELSVWLIKDDRSNPDRVISALVAGRDNISNLDYALIDANALSERDIHIVENLVGANTLDDETNRSWHYHIIELSLRKISDLARLIMSGEKLRISEKDVKRLIKQGVDSGYILSTKLKPDILKYIT